ncbi:MAG: glycosyltransferase family 4 protein [Xanthomonadaceae bacterium]|nr:glycosyltransferase family 4 protein [Xanthomonadaceae bacterium]
MARPYGRFYHLPTELAALGHDVRVQLCSYRRLDSQVLERDGLVWSSHDFLKLGISRLLRTVESEVREFRPDWIIGCSDSWAGWLAHRLSRRVGCKLAIDAYDNYEAYMPANLPLHWAWRRALRAADLVTATGPQLARKLAYSRRNRADVHLVPMCADPNFLPMDRRECRRRLGLPADVPLFGYSGGWTKSRGSDLILKAFALVRQQFPDSCLVLTGKPPAHARSSPAVISLGYVDDALMPSVTNAVDACCVVLANTSFGRFSYPAKLCEAMACGIPVVASATDAVTWMLGNDTRYLARVGDAEDHARLMLSNCQIRNPGYVLPPSWKENAARLASLLNKPI